MLRPKPPLKKNPPPKAKKDLPNPLIYAHWGIKMMAFMCFAAWLGIQFDNWLQLTNPWGLCIGSLGSTVYMLWSTIRSLT